MPISFPRAARGRPQIQAKNLIQKPFDIVPAPNSGNFNYRFSRETLDGGRGKIFARPNPRNPGVNFGKTFAIANLDQRPATTDPAIWKEVQGNLLTRLTGVSRDSAGAALAGCQVMLFTTGSKAFVAETTSDGSGNWTLDFIASGPFFLVEYKDGATPVAGTSLNTLVPVAV